MKKFILLLLLILISCQREKHKYSFYYSKSNITLDSIEKQALKESSGKLYLRFFQVDKKYGKLDFLKPVDNDSYVDIQKSIVPVVSISNRTFFYLKEESTQILAKTIFERIQKKTKDLGLNISDEVQIDCNWTQATMMSYFNFLEELSKLSKKNISVGIRPHQIKLTKKMGVPPVKKVFLMCYSNYSTFGKRDKKVILDIDLLKNFLADLDNYRIKDIAVVFPIHSCAFVEDNRGNNKMIREIDRDIFHSSKFKKLSKNKFKVLVDGVYFGFFLTKGLQIRVEDVSEQTLDELVDFFDNKLENYKIIYNHLDTEFIKDRNLGR